MNIDFSSQQRRRAKPCAVRGLRRIEALEKRELLTTAHLPSLFGSGPGDWGMLTYRGSFETDDPVDSYFVDLRAGDVLNVTADQIDGGAAPDELILTDHANRTLIHTNAPIPALPSESPLLAGSDVGLAYVITGVGQYKIEAKTTQVGERGSYSINFQVFRPTLEQQAVGTRQVLYLDFDGARLNPFETFKDGTDRAVDLSPFASYLEDFGLVDRNTPLAERERIEDLLIDKIVASVTENLYTDILAAGVNRPSQTNRDGAFSLSIVDSRDGIDRWGEPHVSRVIVGGGNSETGVIGDIAESVDVGNMVTDETAIVQVESKTHLINGPLAFAINPNLPDQVAAKIDLISEYIGNIVAHEAGHLFGLYHMANNEQHVLMDRALTAFLGEDKVYGTQDDFDLDIGFDLFLTSESEFFSTFISGGRANNADWLSFALSTGKVNYGDVNDDGVVDARDLNVLGTNWDQRVAPDTRGDLNGDGLVNAIDLNQIGLGWPRPR